MDAELFSPYLVDILVDEGMRPESVLLTACCDRSVDNRFEDTFVFLTIDRVAFLTVSYDKSVSKVYNGFLSKKGKHDTQKETVPLRKKAFVEYNIKDIKEIRLQKLVASGVVQLKFEDEQKETYAIAAFTNACVADLAKIARAVDKIKKNGVLNIAEFKDKDEELSCPKCGRLYADKARKVCPKCSNTSSTFWRLVKLLPKYKKNIALVILMIVIINIRAVLQPYMQGTVLFGDAITDTGTFWYGKVALVIIIIAALHYIAAYASAYMSIQMKRIAENMMYDLKVDVFKSFQSMSMGYFTKNRIGNIMNRINSDTAAISGFFVHGIPYAINTIISCISGTVMLAIINPKIMPLVVFPAFVIIVVLKATNKFMWRMYTKAWAIGSKITSNVSDSLRGIKVVKAFGKEKTEVTRFEKLNRKCYKINMKLCYMSNLLNPVYGLVLALVGNAVWIISGLEIVGGNPLMNYGVLATSLSYFTMMLSPIQQFSSFTEWTRNAMNSAQRMYELIDAEPDVKESRTPIVMDKVKGDIKIKDVTFGYEPNSPILKGLNCEIKAGEMIGIVGHSGAGKSTLINLITRMYDVNEGSIEIDGYNIKDLSIATLRQNIALVTQETYIFQGTVLENIAYSNPDAKRDDVIAAAKVARAHDFIEAMPEGYDTMVGTGHRSMSGGERQRISIARAILANPRILILDEATAALDTETEMSIQEALDKLTEGRTTLAIAHRLSTLRNADRLVVIEDGEITEVGTHAELVKNKGVYFNLVRKQAEALKTKGI